MSDAKLVNIARLMTTYNFEIEELPDNLKCAQCKLVFKDACQLPCGCKFCRACIDDLMARGGEFCPGESEDCGDSPLSRFVSDYLANRKVSRLADKCPNNGCVHACQLANMEEHLRECQRKTEECPFRELGCTQDELGAEEMGGHLQHENRRHSEILIGMIVNINREIETLKQRDDASSREIETLKDRNETSSRKIETMTKRDEASSSEIETLKHELVLKDEQLRLIMDQMIHVQNENKSIKNDIKSIKNDIKSINNDIKSIKEEKEDLAGRVRILLEQIEREIDERRENDELDSAKVIDHVDREIAAVTGLIGSNKNQLSTQLQSVRGDIRSINQDVQSIRSDICSVKLQVQSTQAIAGLGLVDASFVWLIEIDVAKTRWYWPDKESEYFSGAMHPYKYRLGSGNFGIDTADARLCIQLLIHASSIDGQLTWPFEARVVITVTDRDILEVYRSISLQCQIERPTNNQYRWSDPFVFSHSELITAGLNLSRGVRVSCMIVPSAG